MNVLKTYIVPTAAQCKLFPQKHLRVINDRLKWRRIALQKCALVHLCWK